MADQVMIDTLGVTTNPEGESWVTFSPVGPAFSLTPPFQASEFRVSPGSRLGRGTFLDLDKFTSSKGVNIRSWGEKVEAALQEVAWALPVPYLKAQVPVHYMRTDRGPEVLQAMAGLSGLVAGATALTHHWLTLPKTMRDSRVCDSNIGAVVCWGVTSGDQPLMREVERADRRVPLLWVTDDEFLIKSPVGRWLDADKFLTAANKLLRLPDFNPYAVLRTWAIQRFEHRQFDVAPHLYFLHR